MESQRSCKLRWLSISFCNCLFWLCREVPNFAEPSVRQSLLRLAKSLSVLFTVIKYNGYCNSKPANKPFLMIMLLSVEETALKLKSPDIRLLALL